MQFNDEISTTNYIDVIWFHRRQHSPAFSVNAQFRCKRRIQFRFLAANAVTADVLDTKLALFVFHITIVCSFGLADCI